jgi:hypothetical protein
MVFIDVSYSVAKHGRQIRNSQSHVFQWEFCYPGNRSPLYSGHTLSDARRDYPEVEISSNTRFDTQNLAAFSVLFAVAEQRSFRCRRGSNRERCRSIHRPHLQAHEMIFSSFMATWSLFVKIGVYRYERRKQHEGSRERKGGAEPTSIAGGSQDIHSPAGSGAYSDLLELLASAKGRLDTSWMAWVSVLLTARAGSLMAPPVGKCHISEAVI